MRVRRLSFQRFPPGNVACGPLEAVVNTDRGSTQVVIGLLVAAIGVVLLLSTIGVAVLGSVILWIPSLFILFGLWRLVASGFRRVSGPVMIILVAAFVQLAVLGVSFAIIWPAVLIAIGVAIVLHQLGRRRSGDAGRTGPDDGGVDTFNLMGSVRRSASPGDYRSGEVTAIMGSTHLDMRDAVIVEKPSMLEVTAVMSEVRLRVPPGWRIRLNNTTLLGETDDQRRRDEDYDTTPDLVIGGLVLMGSLKIDD